MQLTVGFNPYAPPASSDAPCPTEPGARPRSRVPLVCGILSITFSGLFLMPLLVGLGSAAIFYTAARPPPAEAVPATQPAPKRPNEPLSDSGAVVLGLAVLLLTPALLVLGIGQVRYKRWTLVGTTVWAGLAVLSLLTTVLLSSVASTDRFTHAARMLPAVICLAPYPIVLLSLYSRRRVRASLTARDTTCPVR